MLKTTVSFVWPDGPNGRRLIIGHFEILAVDHHCSSDDIGYVDFFEEHAQKRRGGNTVLANALS
ncbi:hypothetical protein [Afipia felis]|uniref:hypothetical protein n=1 Tax=Afipia felis TaxID=1035 RepID=UPI0011C06046|nr:hypothetical protein [Afipia felis]